MTALTLFLGGGGVGKTTLSAALGIARARAGAEVALLSVDPARRLRSALRLDSIDDAGVTVEPRLRASLLEPEVCLRRWAREACPDEAGRLLEDPFFRALADRVAAATDAIAVARAVEWAERAPTLDHLVIDTAPGVAGIELLARPEKLLAMLEGRVIRWLRHARRGGLVLAGLSRIAGLDALERLGQFIGLVDAGVRQLARRLERGRHWLRQASVIVVAAVSPASARAAAEIAAAVEVLALRPRLAVLNRALPPSLVAPAVDDPTARRFLHYVDQYRGLQQQVAAELGRWFPKVVALPESGRTDLDGLAELGARLMEAGLGPS